MKKTVSVLLMILLCMSLLLYGCAAPAAQEEGQEPALTAEEQPAQEETPQQPEPLYTAGTYEASAAGNNGPVTVAVTFTEQEITAVEIRAHAETPGISDGALESLPAAIVENQSLAVDTYTGATHTSEAILSAVEDCVRQAGGDPEALKAKTVEEEKSTEKVELSADVVIVGAGGAGMSTAVSASDAGASVILIEKMPFAGGATSLSGGLVNAAGTEIQKAQDITEDTIDLHISDTWNRGSQLGDIELVTMLCNEVIPTMEWMSSLGLEWSSEVQQKPDCTYPRSHTPARPEGYTGKLGGIITGTLEDAVKERNIDLMLSTTCTGILMEEGKAVGVTAEGADGATYTIRGSSIVLAAGGFADNGEMVHQYDETIPAESVKGAYPGATGEVLRMADEIGANLVGMEYIKSLLFSDGVTTDFTNAILVNGDGQRFTNELAKAEVLNAAIFQQASSYIIYDANVVGEVNDAIRKKLDEGGLISGETLEELAGKIGVNAENLAATVEAYNKMAAGEETDSLGRTSFGTPVEKGPFYAATPYMQVSYTNGGVQINQNLEVISKSGEVISGLFAAGEITGGVHGSYRVGGNAVAEAITFGRLCGQSAAAYAQGN